MNRTRSSSPIPWCVKINEHIGRPFVASAVKRNGKRDVVCVFPIMTTYAKAAANARAIVDAVNGTKP